jgi:excisionase family DNA binding protein
MSDEYMTFEQAAEFLNTSSSTLYRWLREERVPAHKLGRQWRFLREELERWRAGERDDSPALVLAKLEQLLKTRLEERKEKGMERIETTDSDALGARILWDAFDSGASVVHVQPFKDHHQLSYRTNAGLEHLIELPADAFEALDRQWSTASQPTRTSRSRRMYIERERGAADERDALQVRYQKLETLAGDRLTLQLLRTDPGYISLSRVAHGQDEQQLQTWLTASHGLILISGKSGSGKTTTAYACLNELATRGDLVIFTIEETAGTLLPGVNQVEIDLDDAAAYRATFSAIFNSDLDVLFIASTFAQPHQSLLWSTAINAAESGHLVLVQIEAESAHDAIARFGEGTDRSFDDVLIGSCWQQLVPNESGQGREAVYEMVDGALAPGQ